MLGRKVSEEEHFYMALPLWDQDNFSGQSADQRFSFFFMACWKRKSFGAQMTSAVIAPCSETRPGSKAPILSSDRPTFLQVSQRSRHSNDNNIIYPHMIKESLATPLRTATHCYTHHAD